jgi:hypothetical protein
LGRWVEEEVEGQSDGLLAFPLVVGHPLSTALEAFFAGAGGFEDSPTDAGVHGHPLGAAFGVEDVEETDEQGFGAVAPSWDGAVELVEFGDDAVDAFALQGVGDGHHHDRGFLLSEGVVEVAVTGDLREGQAGGLGGAGFFAVGFEFFEVDGDPFGGTGRDDGGEVGVAQGDGGEGERGEEGVAGVGGELLLVATRTLRAACGRLFAFGDLRFAPVRSARLGLRISDCGLRNGNCGSGRLGGRWGVLWRAAGDGWRGAGTFGGGSVGRVQINRGRTGWCG